MLVASTNEPARRRSARPLAAIAVAAACLAAAGCGRVDTNTRFVNEQRADKGLVVILPGIEGESAANRDIRRGLDDAGIPYALAIYRWGFPVPGIGLIVNQTNAGGNREAGKELAGRIVKYQQKYPGRPVHIIGHSGGGGVTVFTLEALRDIPDAKPIDGAFLLSASISSDYDLSKALTMTTKGLVNAYNPEDDLLDSGTAIMGNVDGKRGPSAGRTGFTRTFARVYQRRITGAELGVGGSPHFVATNHEVICKYAPPWIRSDVWPVPR